MLPIAGQREKHFLPPSLCSWADPETGTLGCVCISCEVSCSQIGWGPILLWHLSLHFSSLVLSLGVSEDNGAYGSPLLTSSFSGLCDPNHVPSLGSFNFSIWLMGVINEEMVLTLAAHILKLKWYREGYHSSCTRMKHKFVKHSIVLDVENKLTVTGGEWWWWG